MLDSLTETMFLFCLVHVAEIFLRNTNKVKHGRKLAMGTVEKERRKVDPNNAFTVLQICTISKHV